MATKKKSTAKEEKPDIETKNDQVTLMAMPPDLYNSVVDILMNHTTPAVSYGVLKDIESKVQAVKV